MHLKLSTWLSLIALLALFTSGVWAQTPADSDPNKPATASQIPGTIRVARKSGTVRAKNNATAAVQDLNVGMNLKEGVTVTTGVASSVVLLFSNGASVSLESDSELNIERYLQDPFPDNVATFEPANSTEEPSMSTTHVKLNKGELIGKVLPLKKALKGSNAPESKFTVTTPVGAAGIRGTTFRIVYRPDGNGRFNFLMTTVEGNVEVKLATGTVNAAKVSVTDNKEIVLNNVEVNVVNNQVVATTANGQTVTVAALPPPTDAPVTTLTQVQATATQIVQALVNVVFAPPTPPPAGTSPPASNGNPNPATDDKKDTTPKDTGTKDTGTNNGTGTNNNSSPGTTTQQSNSTNPR